MDDPREPGTDYEQVLVFDTDDPTFVRGVQFGMIYGMAFHPTFPHTVLTYAENAEMLARLREVAEVPFAVSEAGDDWIAVTFAAQPEEEGP